MSYRPAAGAPADAPALRAHAALPDSRFTLLGRLTGYEVRGRTLVLIAGTPRLAVSFTDAGTARVRLAPTGDFRRAGHGADAHETPFSYALDPAAPPPPAAGTLHVRDTGAELVVAEGPLVLRVRKNPCRLRFETPDGRTLLADSAGAGFADVDGRTEVRCWMALHPEARFFGLGDKTFELDRRGRRLTFWNADTYAYAPEQDPIYKSIPFALTLAPAPSVDDAGDVRWTGAGLFFDNSFRATMDFGADDAAEDFWFGALDGELRYYVFAPDAAEDLKTPLRRYCDLTGHKPMPALWSLGYHQSRWNYHDEGYARWIGHEFRRRGLPLECIHLDIGHMEGYRVFTWNEAAFPDPKALHDDLAALGIRTVCIVDPGVKVDPGYFAYDEGARRGLFVTNPDGSYFTDTVWPGDVHWPDFSRPDTRDWWGEQHRRYLDAGVTGFWNDMNEPAILGGRDFPDEVRFAYADRGTGPADHREAHNTYGLLMARATYEGLRRLRPDERPFLLTRACFSGSQRYAAAWTGDNVSSWEHLLLSLRICQSLSASGLAFCGPDIGGFAGQPSPELFARWMQAGVCYPFMRTHYSHEEIDRQEPWSFGEEAERIARRYLYLRYELLPYLYSAFEACTRTAEPPMKALALEHPGDACTHRGTDDTFYFGPALVAAPVVAEGARERTLYLPDVPGGWFSFWDGTRYAGGAEHTVPAPLDTLPLFARAGRVVAMHPPMRHTGEFVPEALRLRAFAGTGESEVYFDDGLSYAFASGDFLRLRLALRQAAEGGLDVALSREGRRDLPYRFFDWTVVGAAPGEVSADGRPLARLDAAEALEQAREGFFTEGDTVRIRTRTDVQALVLR
ncbi:MAG: TIM-barrel domain-containing protein [Rubricoccaceae bacterium]